MLAGGFPVLALGLWILSTLGWWAFAFLPLPAAPPEWLAAARAACFGMSESGLPGTEGWMLLVLAPATFLIGIFALWGADLPAALARLMGSRGGRVAVAALVLGAVVEAGWVITKVSAALAVARADAARVLPVADTDLPHHYPRQTTPAPAFTLVDQHGASIGLAGLRGRPVVVTFVFAHCQTMCPVIVESIKRAGPDAADATVLLVTLDPWRDTVGTLPHLARQWALPPGFHVLSAGDPDEVLGVVRAFGMPWERNATTGDIAHPALVFLIDADGRLAYTFNNPPPAWIREGLARLA